MPISSSNCVAEALSGISHRVRQSQGLSSYGVLLPLSELRTMLEERRVPSNANTKESATKNTGNASNGAAFDANAAESLAKALMESLGVTEPNAAFLTSLLASVQKSSSGDSPSSSSASSSSHQQWRYVVAAGLSQICDSRVPIVACHILSELFSIVEEGMWFASNAAVANASCEGCTKETANAAGEHKEGCSSASLPSSHVQFSSPASVETAKAFIVSGCCAILEMFFGAPKASMSLKNKKNCRRPENKKQALIKAVVGEDSSSDEDDDEEACELFSQLLHDYSEDIIFGCFSATAALTQGLSSVEAFCVAEHETSSSGENGAVTSSSVASAASASSSAMLLWGAAQLEKYATVSQAMRLLVRRSGAMASSSSASTAGGKVRPKKDTSHNNDGKGDESSKGGEGAKEATEDTEEGGERPSSRRGKTERKEGPLSGFHLLQSNGSDGDDDDAFEDSIGDAFGGRLIRPPTSAGGGPPNSAHHASGGNTVANSSFGGGGGVRTHSSSSATSPSHGNAGGPSSRPQSSAPPTHRHRRDMSPPPLGTHSPAAGSSRPASSSGVVVGAASATSATASRGSGLHRRHTIRSYGEKAAQIVALGLQICAWIEQHTLAAIGEALCAAETAEQLRKEVEKEEQKEGINEDTLKSLVLLRIPFSVPIARAHAAVAALVPPHMRASLRGALVLLLTHCVGLQATATRQMVAGGGGSAGAGGAGGGGGPSFVSSSASAVGRLHRHSASAAAAASAGIGGLSTHSYLRSQSGGTRVGSYAGATSPLSSSSSASALTFTAKLVVPLLFVLRYFAAVEQQRAALWRLNFIAASVDASSASTAGAIDPTQGGAFDATLNINDDEFEETDDAFADRLVSGAVSLSGGASAPSSSSGALEASRRLHLPPSTADIAAHAEWLADVAEDALLPALNRYCMLLLMVLRGGGAASAALLAPTGTAASPYSAIGGATARGSLVAAHTLKSRKHQALLLLRTADELSVAVGAFVEGGRFAADCLLLANTKANEDAKKPTTIAEDPSEADRLFGPQHLASLLRRILNVSNNNISSHHQLGSDGLPHYPLSASSPALGGFAPSPSASAPASARHPLLRTPAIVAALHPNTYNKSHQTATAEAGSSDPPSSRSGDADKSVAAVGQQQQSLLVPSGNHTAGGGACVGPSAAVFLPPPQLHFILSVLSLRATLEGLPPEVGRRGGLLCVERVVEPSSTTSASSSSPVARVSVPFVDVAAAVLSRLLSAASHALWANVVGPILSGLEEDEENGRGEREEDEKGVSSGSGPQKHHKTCKPLDIATAAALTETLCDAVAAAATRSSSLVGATLGHSAHAASVGPLAALMVPPEALLWCLVGGIFAGHLSCFAVSSDPPQHGQESKKMSMYRFTSRQRESASFVLAHISDCLASLADREMRMYGAISSAYAHLVGACVSELRTATEGTLRVVSTAAATSASPSSSAGADNSSGGNVTSTSGGASTSVDNGSVFPAGHPLPPLAAHLTAASLLIDGTVIGLLRACLGLGGTRGLSLSTGGGSEEEEELPHSPSVIQSLFDHPPSSQKQTESEKKEAEAGRMCATAVALDTTMRRAHCSVPSILVRLLQHCEEEGTAVASPEDNDDSGMAIDAEAIVLSILNKSETSKKNENGTDALDGGAEEGVCWAIPPLPAAELAALQRSSAEAAVGLLADMAPQSLAFLADTLTFTNTSATTSTANSNGHCSASASAVGGGMMRVGLSSAASNVVSLCRSTPPPLPSARRNDSGERPTTAGGYNNGSPRILLGTSAGGNDDDSDKEEAEDTTRLQPHHRRTHHHQQQQRKQQLLFPFSRRIAKGPNFSNPLTRNITDADDLHDMRALVVPTLNAVLQLSGPIILSGGRSAPSPAADAGGSASEAVRWWSRLLNAIVASLQSAVVGGGALAGSEGEIVACANISSAADGGTTGDLPLTVVRLYAMYNALTALASKAIIASTPTPPSSTDQEEGDEVAFEPFSGVSAVVCALTDVNAIKDAASSRLPKGGVGGPTATASSGNSPDGDGATTATATAAAVASPSQPLVWSLLTQILELCSGGSSADNDTNVDIDFSASHTRLTPAQRTEVSTAVAIVAERLILGVRSAAAKSTSAETSRGKDEGDDGSASAPRLVRRAAPFIVALAAAVCDEVRRARRVADDASSNAAPPQPLAPPPRVLSLLLLILEDDAVREVMHGESCAAAANERPTSSESTTLWPAVRRALDATVSFASEALGMPAPSASSGPCPSPPSQSLRPSSASASAPAPYVRHQQRDGGQRGGGAASHPSAQPWLYARAQAMKYAME